MNLKSIRTFWVLLAVALLAAGTTMVFAANNPGPAISDKKKFDFEPKTSEKLKEESHVLGVHGKIPEFETMDERTKWVHTLDRIGMGVQQQGTMDRYFYPEGPVANFRSDRFGAHLTVEFKEDSKVEESLVDEIYRIFDRYARKKGVQRVPVVFSFPASVEDSANTMTYAMISLNDHVSPKEADALVAEFKVKPTEIWYEFEKEAPGSSFRPGWKQSFLGSLSMDFPGLVRNPIETDSVEVYLSKKLKHLESRIQEGDYAREARVVLEKRKEIIAILKKHNAIHGIEVKGDLNKISKLREDERGGTLGSKLAF